MARSIRWLSRDFIRRPRTNAWQPGRTRTADVHHFVSSRNRQCQALPEQRYERRRYRLPLARHEELTSLRQTRAARGISVATRRTACQKIKVLAVYPGFEHDFCYL
jgi:hypothetical protein